MKMNRLYPVDVMVYEHIKFFTEKGELKCCCQSNSKIGDEIGRHKTNISRSISKLKNLGYIKIEDENGRKLSTTDKQISVKYSKTPIDNLAMDDDNLAMDDDNLAMLVDILATPVDNLAMDRLIISLRGVDNLAKHNIEFKLRYLNSHFKEETKKYAFEGDVIKLNHDDYNKWKNLFPNIDLDYELRSRDFYLQGVDKEIQKKWFFTTPQDLNKKNKEQEPVKYDPLPVVTEEQELEQLYRGLKR